MLTRPPVYTKCRVAGLVFLVAASAAAQTAPAERIRALNQELTALASSPGANSAARARDAVRARLGAFRELAETDAAAALTLLLPDNSLNALRAIGPDVAAGLESEGQWAGPVEVVAEDDFAHHAAKIHVSIRVEGRPMAVFATGETISLQSGNVISGGGVRMGSMLLLRRMSLVATPAAASCSSLGVQKLAVVMVNFASSSIDTSSVNSSTLGAIATGATHNLSSYWHEASYGQTVAAADVYGPYNLGADYGSSDYDAIETAAINAAANTGGVNLGNYTHLVIIMPDGFPVGGGLGTVGCASLTSPTTGAFTSGVVWIRADFTLPNDVGVCAFAHENGHNMGLNHASTESYGSVPLGSFGTVPVHNEYGSYFSLMSECNTIGGTTLLGHYDAQHKVSLGWFASTNYQTVSSSGTFVLAPTERLTSNLHAIRVQRGQENNFWLWLEYRQSAGYDATFSALNSQIFSGAMIHFEDPTATQYIGYTRLLNYTAPANADFSEPSLAVGQSWSDPYSLLTLNVTSADAAGLHVTVNYDTPCLTFSPTSKTYGSSAAVPSDSVTLTGSPTCAWTATANASWITVTGGASGTGPGTVTYSLSANTTPSPRTATISIARQAFTITQPSSNPQPTPVSVSPNNSSSTIGTYQTFTMTYSDAGGASNLAEASVLFNTSTAQTSACSVAWYKSDNSVRLWDDNADGYEYALANQNGLLSNSQCTVSFLNAVATAGNNLTLTLSIKFTASFAGAKNIYLEAQDSLGADSGSVTIGGWTVLTSSSPILSIAKSHSGNFVQGQTGATYQVTVSNSATAAATSGAVTMTETIPAGLTLASMSGSGWTCPPNGTTCTRSDPLGTGSSYPTILVTVNVASNAGSPVTNQVGVSGGGSSTANANDPTIVAAPSPCDVNQDGSTNIADVQKMINEALGILSATNDLNSDGKVNVVDIQIVINAALGGACSL